jgi:hypothetical protein
MTIKKQQMWRNKLRRNFIFCTGQTAIQRKQIMDDYSFARYEKFGRVFAFGQKNLADVSGTDAPQHLTNLKADYDGLTQAKAGQGGGSATPVTVLIDALRLDVQNVTRTAHALAQDDPNYTVLFRPPEALNPRAIISAADAILVNLIVGPNDDAATKTAKADRIARFNAKGLPSGFEQTLVTDRAAIDTARTTENNADNQGAENTAAIGRLVRDGMKECNYLDAIFHNVYVRNPDMLRGWMSASHLERAAQHAATPAPTPPPAGATPKP